MAARGSEAKNLITKIILSTFAGSFTNDKEIRIPAIENGEEIQIKLSLTAAKDNLINPCGNAQQTTVISNEDETASIEKYALTAEEVEQVNKMLKALGVI